MDTSAHAHPPLPVRLNTWPTPLEPAPRLAERIGLRPEDLWIKRDDLAGLGAGGNKARKIEHTLGAAMAAGATILITSGAAQSNHARVVAAGAARLGLECLLILAGGPSAGDSGNLSLDRLFGARLHWVGEVDDTELERIVDEVVVMERQSGSRPFRIPFGGSSALSARGYVEAADEIVSQAPAAAHVVVAVGSGGTMAGLVSGLGAERVLGIDTGAVRDPLERVRALIGAGAPYELRLDRTQIGSGHGVLTDAARTAMSDAGSTQGLVLDPVYTAKAMAGLTAAVAAGAIRPGERTVFVHTGGLPGLFGHPVAVDLASSR